MAPVPRTCLFRPPTPDKNWFHIGSTMYKAVLEARAKQQALESIVQCYCILMCPWSHFNKGRINEWVPVRLDVWEGQRSFPTRWEEERKCSHSTLLSPLPLRKHPTRLWIGASLSFVLRCCLIGTVRTGCTRAVWESRLSHQSTRPTCCFMHKRSKSRWLHSELHMHKQFSLRYVWRLVFTQVRDVFYFIAVTITFWIKSQMRQMCFSLAATDLKTVQNTLKLGRVRRGGLSMWIRV